MQLEWWLSDLAIYHSLRIAVRTLRKRIANQNGKAISLQRQNPRKPVVGDSLQNRS
jgi:hypothetical protein